MGVVIGKIKTLRDEIAAGIFKHESVVEFHNHQIIL